MRCLLKSCYELTEIQPHLPKGILYIKFTPPCIYPEDTESNQANGDLVFDLNCRSQFSPVSRHQSADLCNC